MKLASNQLNHTLYVNIVKKALNPKGTERSTVELSDEQALSSEIEILTSRGHLTVAHIGEETVAVAPAVVEPAVGEPEVTVSAEIPVIIEAPVAPEAPVVTEEVVVEAPVVTEEVVVEAPVVTEEVVVEEAPTGKRNKRN